MACLLRPFAFHFYALLLLSIYEVDSNLSERNTGSRDLTLLSTDLRWCSVCNADLALSIAMTTCSTVLSCGLTPLNMLLYTYGTDSKGWTKIGRETASWPWDEKIVLKGVCFMAVAEQLGASHIFIKTLGLKSWICPHRGRNAT